MTHRPLGPKQGAVIHLLEAATLLNAFTGWYEGCGGEIDNARETRRIMRSLVKRGYLTEATTPFAHFSSVFEKTRFHQMLAWGPYRLLDAEREALLSKVRGHRDNMKDVVTHNADHARENHVLHKSYLTDFAIYLHWAERHLSYGGGFRLVRATAWTARSYRNYYRGYLAAPGQPYVGA